MEHGHRGGQRPGDAGEINRGIRAALGFSGPAIVKRERPAASVSSVIAVGAKNPCPVGQAARPLSTANERGNSWTEKRPKFAVMVERALADTPATAQHRHRPARTHQVSCTCRQTEVYRWAESGRDRSRDRRRALMRDRSPSVSSANPGVVVDRARQSRRSDVLMLRRPRTSGAPDDTVGSERLKRGPEIRRRVSALQRIRRRPATTSPGHRATGAIFPRATGCREK